jgi:hypothetical protein
MNLTNITNALWSIHRRLFQKNLLSLIEKYLIRQLAS